MRIVFLGTPDFAVASLRRLVENGHTLCGVFTQPDKPKNRGHKLTFSPVKEYALSQSLPVYQPVKIREPEAVELVRSLAPELLVTAAYGQILPEEILRLPPYGAINVHASLLPKYRGAAPINWAILNGETETGITIMHMAKALDAGDMIVQKRTLIGPEENAQQLTERLAELGAQALAEAAALLAEGRAPRTAQNEADSTYASMLSRELSPMDWSRPAHVLQCQVRGLIPWPCASTDIFHGVTMKIYAAEEPGFSTQAAPGTVVAAGKAGIDIACGDGQVLRITQLQAQGGKRMTAAAYLLGHPISL